MTSRMTLLDMTQNILSAMESDEVNSINDTVESQQVAEVIRETYFELFANLIEPSRKGLIQLQSTIDPVNRPNTLVIPDSVVNVDWIRYNGKLLTWQDPEYFIQTAYNYSVTPPTTVGFYARYSDRDPTYWTSFDNEVIVFDSWNSSIDTTLQQSKSSCWGQLDFVFEMTDDFVPPLDPNRFPGFLAEAKSVCFVNFKQVSSSKEEARSRRQQVRFQNNRWRAGKEAYFFTPNYGRTRGYSSIWPRRFPRPTA